MDSVLYGVLICFWEMEYSFNGVSICWAFYIISLQDILVFLIMFGTEILCWLYMNYNFVFTCVYNYVAPNFFDLFSNALLLQKTFLIWSKQTSFQMKLGNCTLHTIHAIEQFLFSSTHARYSTGRSSFSQPRPANDNRFGYLELV